MLRFDIDAEVELTDLRAAVLTGHSRPICEKTDIYLMKIYLTR